VTIDEAVAALSAERESACLSGWSLVAAAQRLVAANMAYSYFNSLDFPARAFAKGRGYCWQQAGAFRLIARRLGFDCRLVYATRNQFPDVLREGVLVRVGVSGHVWCRVRLAGEERDVCVGDVRNVPGRVHFCPLSPVSDYRGLMVIFGFLGSIFTNRRRGAAFRRAKARLARQA
jgi:hypothetical protein